MSEVKTNKISSLASNNDITLDPDGTGDVIVASGNVGIGTSTVDSALHIEQDASGVTETSGSTLKIHNTNSSGRSKISLHNSAETASGSIYYDTDSGGLALQGDTGAIVAIHTGGNNERLRVDTSGRVCIGGTNPSQKFVVTNAGANNIIMSENSSASIQMFMQAQSSVGVVGTLTNHNLDFLQNNTIRARFDTNGDLMIGKTTSSFSTKGFFLNVDPGQLDITCNGNNPLRLNRLASDGILTSYQQAGSEEGTVSVSGTTVSYNGGHLSRWSRLTSGNKDTSIVKGTVMTNLDQMVVWTHAATDDEAEWTEDNEQLNCMAVSSVEGDANVAGVFVNWDDRDSYNDMNIAMTGDMVIRIAGGTTVARGDLLMSAGDGTAKPQDDDIVRSKTIAKVTSTTKSHTYDDGSYLVPCVLMAC